MADNSSAVRGSGIGFVGALQLLFLGLKLGDVGMVSGWSWWWVLSPTWITLLLAFTIILIILIGVSNTNLE